MDALVIRLERLPPELVEPILDNLNLWSICQVYKISTRLQALILQSRAWAVCYPRHNSFHDIVEAVDFAAEIFEKFLACKYLGPRVANQIHLNKGELPSILFDIRALHRFELHDIYAIDAAKFLYYRRSHLKAQSMLHCLRYENEKICFAFCNYGNLRSWDTIFSCYTTSDSDMSATESRRRPRLIRPRPPSGDPIVFYNTWRPMRPRPPSGNWLAQDVNEVREAFHLYMSAELSFHKKEASQLVRLASLIRQYPRFLKPSHDVDQSASNRAEVVSVVLEATAEQMTELRIMRKNKGSKWVFGKAILPVVPYDRYLWLFLAGMALRKAHLDDTSDLPIFTHEQLAMFAKFHDKFQIAMDGLPFSYHQAFSPGELFPDLHVRRIYARTDLKPILIQRHSDAGYFDASSFADRSVIGSYSFATWDIPRLGCNGSLPLWDDLELDWLEAFLGSVAALESIFPDLAKEMQEAQEAEWPSIAKCNQSSRCNRRVKRSQRILSRGFEPEMRRFVKQSFL